MPGMSAGAMRAMEDLPLLEVRVPRRYCRTSPRGATPPLPDLHRSFAIPWVEAEPAAADALISTAPSQYRPY